MAVVVGLMNSDALMLDLLWRIGGLVGVLLAVIYGWVRWEQKRTGRNLHDLRGTVNRHEQWITIIREKLGIGPSHSDDD